MPGPDNWWTPQHELKVGDRVQYKRRGLDDPSGIRGTVKKLPSGLKNMRVDWDDGTSTMKCVSLLEKINVLDQIVEALDGS